MRATLLVAVAACASAPAPVAAPTITDDAGAFTFRIETQVVSRETFTIRRLGDHRVIHSKAAAIEDPANNSTEGELETDAAFHPIRASYRRITPADAYTYKLGGSPLTLDVTRDDGRTPKHTVATAPVDVFFEGPGASVYTAVCAIAADRRVTTIGNDKSLFVEVADVYAVTHLGKLHTVAIDTWGIVLELACDGDTLIGGRLDAITFVRDGREHDLEAFLATPAVKKRVWSHDGSQLPWHARIAWLDGEVVVAEDARRDGVRQTSFDLKTGATRSSRAFVEGTEPAPKLGVDPHACEEAAASVRCGTSTFAITYNGEASVISGPSWQVALKGHPMGVWQVGETLIVPTDTMARRVIALDANTGAERWVGRP
jgi:hypothetical protein